MIVYYNKLDNPVVQYKYNDKSNIIVVSGNIESITESFEQLF